MGITERRQSEIEAIRKKIIDTASEILVSEGWESLSIRKIANKIEYSPGIIYHYFKDKNEIVATIVENGYEEMLKKIINIPGNGDNLEEEIVSGLKAYIEFMLENPEKFKIILMTDVEVIQEKVSMLERGISNHRKSIANLCRLLNLGIEKNKFKEMDVELTAQIIWTSTHGLLSRLILEKNISSEQQERLINQHFKMMVNALMS